MISYIGFGMFANVKIKESGNKDYKRFDMYIDDELFKVVEQYYDEDGYLIYEYVDEKPADIMLNNYNKPKKDNHKPKKKFNEQHQTKINKKLNKNRRRG